MIAPTESTSTWRWGQAWVANAKTLLAVAFLAVLPLTLFRWGSAAALPLGSIAPLKPLFALVMAASGVAILLVATLFGLQALLVVGRYAHGATAAVLAVAGLLLLDVALAAGTHSLFDDVHASSLVVRCVMAWGPAAAAVFGSRTVDYTAPLRFSATRLSVATALFVLTIVGLGFVSRSGGASSLAALRGLPLLGAGVSMVLVDRFARTRDAELGRRMLLATVAVVVLESGLLLLPAAAPTAFASFAFLSVLYAAVFVWTAGNDVAQLLSRLAHAERDLELCGQQLLAQQRKLHQQDERLEDAGREAEEFARLAAHDLREPLRKVRAFGDRLERRASPDLDDKSRDFLGRMQDAAERMQAMVDGLVAYSQVPAAPLTPGGVNLGDAVESHLEEIRNAGAIVHTSGLGHLSQVTGNEEQIEKLLGQLFDNALKFRTESTVEINVRAEVSSGHCTLVIADNGIGFEPTMNEQIFTLFKRLNGRTAFPGSGVGLSLCRRIAEHSGGQLTATGALSQGATFRLQLPRVGDR